MGAPPLPRAARPSLCRLIPAEPPPPAPPAAFLAFALRRFAPAGVDPPRPARARSPPSPLPPDRSSPLGRPFLPATPRFAPFLRRSCEDGKRKQFGMRKPLQFCKLCVIENEKVNRPLKFMSPVGYKNLSEGFFIETRRDYKKQQFKNKWDSMKKEYTNWMTFKNKTTGLGWNDEANTVVADDDWWKKMGEEFLAFRKRGPEHLDKMSRMFENVLVTGESSFMPGTISGTVLPEGAELHNLDDDDEEVHVTPSNRGKRGAGQLENPKKKNPVQRELKRMVDHMINEDASVASSKVTIVTKIEKIMEEVVMCGAKEGSDEHYIATKLFAKLENRAFFRTFKTNDGKMNWLRRMYEDRRKN
ncbi:hypothetical protein ZWY2020_017121 [Hordeum vulgare]|nr:hypothetical protein ZWY2020_017121 [Hordeum vulgare]